MTTLKGIALIAVILFVGPSWADDTDSNFGSIKKIDLSEDRPQSPNHLLLMLNLNKVKPNTLGKVVLYQFSKRVRLEFEADGLPKGEYILAVAGKCSAGNYGKAWTDLHRFKSIDAHLQTEKSLPQASLSEPKAGALILTGKSLALFRVKPQQMIDCKVIN